MYEYKRVVFFLFLAAYAMAANFNTNGYNSLSNTLVGNPKSIPTNYAYPGYIGNSFWRVNPWSPNPAAPAPWRPYNYFRILRQHSNSYPTSYQYLYDTENQIQAAEEGTVPDYDPNQDIGTNARGFYQYIGDDGLLHRVQYIADERGFRPIVSTGQSDIFNPEVIARTSPVQSFPLGGPSLKSSGTHAGNVHLGGSQRFSQRQYPN